MYTKTSKARLTFERGNKSPLVLQKCVLNWNEKRSKKNEKNPINTQNYFNKPYEKVIGRRWG